jgi:hypothetical protein
VSSRFQFLFPVLIAIASVGIYFGTVFPYLTAPRGEGAGYFPVLLGLTLFALLVGTCTRLLSPVTKLRWLVVCIAVVASIIVCTSLFFLLILNVRGS